MEHHIRLAQQLPPRLLSFFKRFPPAHLTPLNPETTSVPITIAENTSSADPNVGASTTTTTTTTAPVDPYSKRNPFLPFKNPNTGNWHGPTFSLRRQAELFKLAQAHDVLSLMPHSPKHPEVRLEKRVKSGLRVKGTGVGQQVKGKYWERTMVGKLLARQRAMEGMPALIKEWKERGHGRGWKKWPK